MIDQVVKIGIAAAAAIVAWWVADKISMKISDKHLHTHLSEAFKSFFDGIREWCQNHAKRLPKGTQIFLRIAADEADVQMKRVKRWTLSSLAMQPNGIQEQITVNEQTLTDDEVCELGFVPSVRQPQRMEYMEVG